VRVIQSGPSAITANLRLVSCVFDPDLGDDVGVELKTLDLGTTVHLWNRVRPWDDELVQICVELIADGVHGEAHGVTLLGRTNSLTGYFQDLAEGFAGWEGARTWETADRDLRVDAEYLSRGYLNLTWTITPSPGGPRSWSVSMASTVQAGEDMRQLAAAVHRLERPDEG
jgi:hypothetical protein